MISTLEPLASPYSAALVGLTLVRTRGDLAVLRALTRFFEPNGASRWLQPNGTPESTPEMAANRVGNALLALPKRDDHPNGRISG